MKILITGGSGMLGSAILRMYHQQHELHFIARNVAIASELEQRYNVTAHIIDLTDKNAVINACEGMQAIIHCAALSSPWGTYQQFYQANVQVTKNVVEAAHIQGINNIVHISSTSVYFDYSDRLDIKETDPVAERFCNDYALTKYLSEKVIIDGNVKAIILRPRGIFGPNDRAIIPRLLDTIKGHYLFLPSSRNPIVDMTYVDNVALTAMLACIDIDKLEHGEIFNISNAQPMPANTMIKMLCCAIKHPVTICGLPYRILSPLITLNEWIRTKLPSRPEPKVTCYSAGLLNFHQTINISKAQSKLGYQPIFTIEQGIAQYAKWFENKNI